MAFGVLMDIAGVLHDGDRAIPGAAEAVTRLNAKNIPLRFVTNSTRRPKRRILETLAEFGIDASETQVLTPAAATCLWLQRKGYAPHLLIYPDLEEDFQDTPTDGKTAVVVGDAGPYFTYERMNAAFRELASGAPLLALAKNRLFKDADGENSIDAGAFVQALEYASGTEARLFGKPAPAFFKAAAETMGCRLSDVVMIGDDAESDVSGAIEAGVGKGILVKSGKYRAGDERRFPNAPDHVCKDVSAAVDHILSSTT